ncbi:MAG: rhomboid family intramembrane serine protease [Candidatus Micrarchaeia archaeon]|jgi:hypothetical protein
MNKQATFYSYYLIAACAIMFVLQLAAPSNANGLDWVTDTFAITPALALSQPWTFITAAFLHGGYMHLLFNMMALFFFGPYLEYKIGGKRFLLLYFAAAIIGNIGYVLISPNPWASGLGASGAIYGVMGALAILEPNLEVYLFFLTPLPLWMVMCGWTLFNLWGVLTSGTGIGYSAHLAGLLAGAAYAYWLKKKSKSILETYGLD